MKLDRRFSGGLLVTIVLHARARLELRQRRLQHHDRDAGRHRAELGADRSGSPAQLRRELPVSDCRSARIEVAARRRRSARSSAAGRSAASSRPSRARRSASRWPRRTLNAPGNTQRPDVSGTPKVLGGIGSGRALVRHVGFRIACRQHVRQFDAQRRARRPELRQPGRDDRQAVVVPTRIKGEIRVDIFNITNTPHFNNPNGTFLGATFGQITSTIADSERSMRFGFRLMF